MNGIGLGEILNGQLSVALSVLRAQGDHQAAARLEKAVLTVYTENGSGVKGRLAASQLITQFSAHVDGDSILDALPVRPHKLLILPNARSAWIKA